VSQPSVRAPQRFRGEQLGLSQDGPGSIPTYGMRFGALVVDCIASGLVAALFVAGRHARDVSDRLPGSWSLIPLAVDYLVGLCLGGQTLGMHLFGLRVVRLDGRRILPIPAAVRTALLFALIPAVIVDKDARGLHDRLTGTVVVKA
jgi:uncharacterized RDD family membrane protein YckC